MEYPSVVFLGCLSTSLGIYIHQVLHPLRDLAYYNSGNGLITSSMTIFDLLVHLKVVCCGVCVCCVCKYVCINYSNMLSKRSEALPSIPSNKRTIDH